MLCQRASDETARPFEQIAALLEVMKDPVVQVGTVKTHARAEDIGNPNAVKS